MLTIAVSEAELWLEFVAIALKSEANIVRPAIVIRSVINVAVLLATAVSDMESWLTWSTISVKSVANKVRLAIIAKSTAKV